MKRITLNRRRVLASTALISLILLAVPSLAIAQATSSSNTTDNSTDNTTTTNTTTTKTTPSTPTTTPATPTIDKTSPTNTTTPAAPSLSTIQSKGDAEINRRLSRLGQLSTAIASATHLTASDSTYLKNEVNTEISGLTSLETTLNSETTTTAAISDAKNIYTEYRVYLLVVPKVWLVKWSDDQQAIEAKLSTLSGKLSTRINSDKTAGKNVTSLESTLADLNTQISKAQGISPGVETTVLTIQPSDYDANTSILSGYSGKLTTAQTAIKAAQQDSTTIVTALKSL